MGMLGVGYRGDISGPVRPRQEAVAEADGRRLR